MFHPLALMRLARTSDHLQAALEEGRSPGRPRQLPTLGYGEGLATARAEGVVYLPEALAEPVRSLSSMCRGSADQTALSPGRAA